MILYVTKLDAGENVVVSESYEDKQEPVGTDPETGKPRLKLFPATEQVKARANLLASQLAEGERVLITEEPYEAPEQD
jgi:hypothetical protein